ncbi:MAG: AtpZ/AtpI family protein [Dehalococcoidia bacterium]|nr:AtpZ/AtpI family protein [Dehalococcoidia bacterium]
MAGSIVLGVFAGIWLDNRFGTQPILTIIGLLLGLIVAFYGVYQMLLPLLNNNSNKRERR